MLWWNEACDEAVRASSKTSMRLRRFPIGSNALIYQRLRAVAGRVMKYV